MQVLFVLMEYQLRPGLDFRIAGPCLPDPPPTSRSPGISTHISCANSRTFQISASRPHTPPRPPHASAPPPACSGPRLGALCCTTDP